MSGGFGGTFGDVFGTTTTTTTGGGHAAIRAAMGQGQDTGQFWTAQLNRWNNNYVPVGTPLPFKWNNTFPHAELSNPAGTTSSAGFGYVGAPQCLVRVNGTDNLANATSFDPNCLNNIVGGTYDTWFTNAGQWMKALSDAQGGTVVYSRPLFEGVDGDWFDWGIGHNGGNTVGQFNDAFNHACTKIRAGFVGAGGNVAKLKFSLCGAGYGRANGGTGFSATDFSRWNQVMDGVPGHPGVAPFITVSDIDTYSNGDLPTGSSGVSLFLTNWQAWAAGRGLEVGHGEWGIGQLPQSQPNHNWSPKAWADLHTNFWAQLPAGMLRYICLFDQGQIDGSVDWRGVSFVSGTFPGTTGVDGTNVANALKSGALTVDSVTNINGTGALVGGGTLVATGHENVILLTDHPEVDPTGVSDCSDEWQAIVNAAPQGSIIRGQAGATYLFNISAVNDSGATVVLDSSRNFIQIDGNGCTFKQTVSGPYTTTRTDSTSLAIVKRRNLHRAFFSLLGADHCKVYNATFIGANPNSNAVDAAYNSLYESQHIFNLEGVDDFEAYGITAHHNWGDFCAMQPDVGSGVSCSNVHIHDYTYHDNGRQHFTLNAITDLLVENGNAYNIRHAQVDLEPNFTSRALKPAIKRCTFRNVTFGFMRLNLFSAGNTEVADVDTIVFDSCSFFQWKMPDVEGPWTGNRRKNLSIVNCTVLSANPFGGPALSGTKKDPNTGFGVQSTHGVSLGVQQWDGVTVTGNTIYLQNRSPTMVAVWCLDCTGINVHGNILNGTVYELETDVTPGAGTVGTGLLDGGGTLQASGFPTLLATSAVLIGGGALAAAGTVGIEATGLLDGGGSLDGTGVAFTIVDVPGTGLLDGGGSLDAVGIVLELGAGLLDGGGVLVAAGDVGAVDAVGLLDGGGDLSASASVGGIGIFGTGDLPGGGVLVAAGSTRRRHGWHIGCIRLRPPGYGQAPYGKEPYGGLN